MKTQLKTLKHSLEMTAAMATSGKAKVQWLMNSLKNPQRMVKILFFSPKLFTAIWESKEWLQDYIHLKKEEA